jgi:hypothetical protein
MASVPMHQKHSIADQLEQLHQRIARRAYEFFQCRAGWGDALGDWLSAEREVVSKPAVELSEQDGSFTVAAVRIHRWGVLPVLVVPEGRRYGESQSQLSERDAEDHGADRPEPRAKRVSIEAA